MATGARVLAAVTFVALAIACSPFDGTDSASTPSPAPTSPGADRDAAPVAESGSDAAAPFACPSEAGWVCTSFDESLAAPAGWNVTDPASVIVVAGDGPSPPNRLRVVSPAKEALNARLFRITKRSTAPSRMTVRVAASVSGCRGCEIVSVNQWASTGANPLLTVWIEVDGAGALALRDGGGQSTALGPLRSGWHRYELRFVGASVEALVDGASAGTLNVSWSPTADRIETSVGFWRTAAGEAGEALYDDVAYLVE